LSDIRDESGFKIRAEGDQGVDQGVDDQGVEGGGGGWWLRLTQHGGTLRDLAVAKGEKKKFASEG
jgi:hypothetical protein